jgi:hypothetical protein
MTTTFEILYDLAIELQVDPELAKFTHHHNPDRANVEENLRRAICQKVMPGENPITPWKRLRVFCLNFVNRSQPPSTEAEIRRLLSTVEKDQTSDEARVQSITDTAKRTLQGARVNEFVAAVSKITDPQKLSALGGVDYLNWVGNRWLYWVGKSADDLSEEDLLKDIKTICMNRDTKLPGMGLPLSANFFADMGLSAFAKPDLHVTPIINMLQIRTGDEAAFRGIIQIARQEHEILKHIPNFNWLRDNGGLMPRTLDRLIYLIGSDNFNLNGDRSRIYSPHRREMMRDALIAGGLAKAKYQ